MPACQGTVAKSASVSFRALATSSRGWITRRAALVATESTCMIATSGPLPAVTALGSLA